MPKIILSLVLVCCISVIGWGQRIIYSQPDREDQKSTDFEIIGKISDNYLVYKNSRNYYTVNVFDSAMDVVDKVVLDFLPDKVINTDILTFRDFFYFFYQYQKKNVVYCMAAKLDGGGKIIGEPYMMDTTAINFYANNKIYTIINSDDKQRIMALKINSKDPEKNILTTCLFDASLSLLHKTRVVVPMNGKGDFLTEFTLDNKGDLCFAKASGTSQNDNVSSATLLSKRAQEDTVGYYPLTLPDIYLDDIRIRADNVNNRYLLTSFYSKTKRGNIDGLYSVLWDKEAAKEMYSGNTTFSEEVRNNVKSEGNTKSAFNDFFLQNILVLKNGGFAIAAESVYTSTRGVYNNRWDYYNSPYLYNYNSYYWNSPYYSSYYYPWWRWGGYGGQVNRYFADNIAIMYFDSTANLEWTSVIHKSQYDDYTDNYIGYGTLLSGGQVHFLFNQLEKRTLLLTDQTVTSDGQVNRSPTLRNLDKDYQFMPRYAKQVSSHELIVPCQYRNFVCFAKVEF